MGPSCIQDVPEEAEDWAPLDLTAGQASLHPLTHIRGIFGAVWKTLCLYVLDVQLKKLMHCESLRSYDKYAARTAVSQMQNGTRSAVPSVICPFLARYILVRFQQLHVAGRLSLLRDELCGPSGIFTPDTTYPNEMFNCLDLLQRVVDGADISAIEAKVSRCLRN